MNPPTSASYNMSVCEGNDLVLTATGNSSLDFLWTDATNGWTDYGAVVTRTNAQPGMSGPYRVVQLENGCASTPIEINVLVSEYPQIVSVDTFCGGEGMGRITVNATNTSGQVMEYALNDGAYQSSNVFDSLANWMYQVKARSVGGECETVFNGVELYCHCNCDKDAPVSVYPNPSTGNFTVNIKLTEPSDQIKLELYDMTGRRLYTEYTEEPSLMLNRNIEIDHMAAGTYTLKVTVDVKSFLVPITISNK